MAEDGSIEIAGFDAKEKESPFLTEVRDARHTMGNKMNLLLGIAELKEDFGVPGMRGLREEIAISNCLSLALFNKAELFLSGQNPSSLTTEQAMLNSLSLAQDKPELTTDPTFYGEMQSGFLESLPPTGFQDNPAIAQRLRTLGLSQAFQQIVDLDQSGVTKDQIRRLLSLIYTPLMGSLETNYSAQLGDNLDLFRTDLEDIRTILSEKGPKVASIKDLLITFKTEAEERINYAYRKRTNNMSIENVNPSRPILELPSDKAVLVNCSQNKLREVLENLLQNTIRYSPGELSVKMVAEVIDGQVIVSFSDKGIGLEQKDLERIFDRGTRVENEATKDIKGTGEGLGYCKEIIEEQGGRIWAESEGIGKGTTIKFALPLVSQNPTVNPQGDAVAV